MKRWPVVFVFALAAAAMASDAPVSEWAPPGTKVAIGVNVRGLLDSSLAKDLGGEVRGTASMLAAAPSLAGLDPLRDIDRVLILATSAGSKGPSLIVLSGRFDVERLARGATRYRDVPIIRDTKGPDAAIGLIDGETAIVGELAQVEAAIDRRGSGAQLDADLMARIDAAWSRYDVWGLGDCPEGLVAAGNSTDPLNGFDRFSFGATLRQGLELTAEIHPRTRGDEVKMAMALSMIEAAIQQQQPKDSGARIDVHSDNGTLRISVAVPEADLRKAIEAQRGSLASSVSAGLRGAGPAPSRVLEAIGSPARPATRIQPNRVQPAIVQPPQPAVVYGAPLWIAPQPAAKLQIVKAPDGDTMYVKLPGGR
jgi:hypothetical protein